MAPPRLQLDEELDVLLANFPGHADDGAFLDIGMLAHHILHIEGGDVLAPVTQAVALAAVEIEIALAVAGAEVARIKQAIAQGPGRCLGIAKISREEHARRPLAHRDLAELARWHRPPGLIDDRHLEPGQRTSHRAQLAREIAADDARGLGHAVAFAQREGEARLDRRARYPAGSPRPRRCGRHGCDPRGRGGCFSRTGSTLPR